MSTARALRDAIRSSDDLTMPEASALRVLAEYAAKTAGVLRDAWPAIETIAKSMCCSESTARRAVRSLQAKGWLHISESDQSSHTYWITIPHEGGCQSDTRGVSERHPGGVRVTPEEGIEEIKEENTLSSEAGHGPQPQPQPTAGETMTSDDQPTLFASQKAVRLSGEAVETTPAPPPPKEPSDVPRPFKTAAEFAAYQEAAALWRTRARGTLRPHKTLDPTRGAGKSLLRVLRHAGRADILRAILWMTSSAEAEYLRDSSAPRGFDTLWNHRDDYPEKAAEWLEREHAACVIAAAAGVPLPDGMPEVQPEPSPIDLEARAQERYDRINAARARQGLPPLPWRRGGAQ